jgi:hypothetical protein
VGQKTLGGICEHVEEMGIGWGVWSWAIVKANSCKGEKVLLVHVHEGLGKCRVGALTFERLGLIRGISRCVWFVKMGGGTSG